MPGTGAQEPDVLDVPQKMFAAKMREHSCLSAKDAKKLHDVCVEYGRKNGFYGGQAPPTLEETVKKCSAVLRDFGYAILRLHWEENGRTCYMHIRIARRSWDEDLMSAEDKKNNKYFVDLVRKIIEADPEFRVSEIEAFQLAGPAEIKLEQCKVLLKSYVKRGYLEYVHDHYSLGPYAMHQYDDMILEFLPNVSKCDVCSKILLRGFSCAHCPGKLHKHCYRALMQKNKKALVCMQCRNPYPDLEEQTGTNENDTGDGNPPSVV